jgi:methyl-accepting chemotaxis protein
MLLNAAVGLRAGEQGRGFRVADEGRTLAEENAALLDGIVAR